MRGLRESHSSSVTNKTWLCNDGLGDSAPRAAPAPGNPRACVSDNGRFPCKHRIRCHNAVTFVQSVIVT